MKLMFGLVAVFAMTVACSAQPAHRITLNDFRTVKVAGHCTTTCQWIFNQQVCNTHCY